MLARYAATFGLLAAVGGTGCKSGFVSCASEPDTEAVVRLSCAATDVTSVTLTGPCANHDAGPPSFWNGALGLQSATPGDCRLKLTFATGFTYSTVVTFASEDFGGQNCGGTYVVPHPYEVIVNNPSDTCIDAGSDMGIDAGADAGADVGADE